MLEMIDDGKRDCRRGRERESESKGRSCSVLVRDRIAKQRHLRSSFLKATEESVYVHSHTRKVREFLQVSFTLPSHARPESSGGADQECKV